MEMGYDIVFKIAIVALAMMVIAVLVRAIKGPRIADRIMAINMIGTMTTSMILIVDLLLDETWLYDICIVYCTISFLAVAVLTKVYIPEETDMEEEEEEGGDHLS